jgi:hypothetical protein
VLLWNHSRYNTQESQTKTADFDWPFYAPSALILALLCTYMPYKLYTNMRYELKDSHHTKLEHEKNMGFLYVKYKPE